MTTHDIVETTSKRAAAVRLPKASSLVKLVLERVRGIVGFAILILGFALLLEALLGYLLSDNSLRRMDFVLSGGAIGLGLVIAGAIVMVVDWIDALPEAGHDVAADEFIKRLRQMSAERQPADPHQTAGDFPTTVIRPVRAAAGSAAVVIASSASYHRPQCRLARPGYEQVRPAVARQRRLSPCKLCNPDAD
jgi:hypothetical protein